MAPTNPSPGNNSPPQPIALAGREMGRAVVWLSGEHDVATAPELGGILAEAIAGGHRRPAGGSGPGAVHGRIDLRRSPAYPPRLAAPVAVPDGPGTLGPGCSHPHHLRPRGAPRSARLRRTSGAKATHGLRRAVGRAHPARRCSRGLMDDGGGRRLRILAQLAEGDGTSAAIRLCEVSAGVTRRNPSQYGVVQRGGAAARAVRDPGPGRPVSRLLPNRQTGGEARTWRAPTATGPTSLPRRCTRASSRCTPFPCVPGAPSSVRSTCSGPTTAR